jgi:ribosomal protein S18 acetylase RimI-like enzyme
VALFDELILRPAAPGDADAAAPLLYAADEEVWDFIFARGGSTATAYLADAFRRGTGLWGPEACTAAVFENKVVGVAAVWTPAERATLERQTSRHIRSYYGPLSAAQVMVRSMLVGRCMPTPKGNVAYLAALGVAGDLRGRGVGTALIAQVMAGVRAQGLPSLTLDVSTARPQVQRLYERLGFVVAGQSRFGRLQVVRRMERRV